MANPADLDPSAVELPAPELHEAEIRDDAGLRTDEVRCVIPSFSELHTTDPMEWTPVTTADGEFWPKQGDRAVVSAHADGPAAILWWRPADYSEPDVAL